MTDTTAGAPAQVLSEPDVLAAICANHERVMYAAWIDIHRGDAASAARMISWQLDGWDGPAWDGTESGLQYLTRARRAAETGGSQRPVTSADGLNDLVRHILQSLPDTADEQEWRDRAGALGVHDPGGQPYRAYTEEDM